MQNKNELVSFQGIKDRKKFMSEMNKEIHQDIQGKMKDKVKNLMKQIAMTKKVLEKQEEELENILSGKKEIMTDEEYLFK